MHTVHNKRPTALCQRGCNSEWKQLQRSPSQSVPLAREAPADRCISWQGMRLAQGCQGQPVWAWGNTGVAEAPIQKPILQGPQQLPTWWSHVPDVGMVSYTSYVPQHDARNYPGPCITPVYWIWELTDMLYACVVSPKFGLCSMRFAKSRTTAYPKIS